MPVNVRPLPPLPGPVVGGRRRPSSASRRSAVHRSRRRPRPAAAARGGASVARVEGVHVVLPGPGHGVRRRGRPHASRPPPPRSRPARDAARRGRGAVVAPGSPRTPATASSTGLRGRSRRRGRRPAPRGAAGSVARGASGWVRRRAAPWACGCRRRMPSPRRGPVRRPPAAGGAVRRGAAGSRGGPEAPGGNRRAPPPVRSARVAGPRAVRRGRAPASGLGRRRGSRPAAPGPASRAPAPAAPPGAGRPAADRRPAVRLLLCPRCRPGAGPRRLCVPRRRSAPRALVGPVPSTRRPVSPSVGAARALLAQLPVSPAVHGRPWPTGSGYSIIATCPASGSVSSRESRKAAGRPAGHAVTDTSWSRPPYTSRVGASTRSA